MSTPPTGEDPQRAPDPSPTPPHRYGQQPPFAQQPYLPQQPPWPQQPSGQPPQFGPPPGARPGYAPYSQPGPPAWQPGPDRKRRRLVIALQLVALAIVVTAATLVYVLSSTILDRSAVEKAVAQQFQRREGVALDLQCRHRMIVRPGADYECKGTTADGEQVEIRISITDENGAYTWSED